MDRQELKTRIQELGISQKDLARLVGVTARAVNLWMTGTRSVPPPVSAYLRLLASLPTGMQQAELKMHLQEIKPMKDGFYLIQFAGQAGTGAGMLIFDGGRIYGADTGAAKYDGEYQFNEATGLVDVTIDVQMPAGESSVIGMAQPFDWILNVSAAMDPEKDSAEMDVQTNLGPIVANYRFLRPLPLAA
jgi:transcriptional regulator with XRE-family HTH domain